MPTDQPAVIGRLYAKRIVSIAVSVVLIVAIFWFVIPQVADFSKVWDQIRAMTWLELTVLGLVAAWNLVTYRIVIVAATPGLTYRQAIVVTGKCQQFADSGRYI